MNRSRLLVLLAGVLVLVPAVAMASLQTYKGFNVVNVLLDGQGVAGDVPAIILDGRTLLPVRALAEALGTDVKWDPESRTASLSTQPRLDSIRTQDGLRLSVIGFSPQEVQAPADAMAGQLKMTVAVTNQSGMERKVDLNGIQLHTDVHGADGTMKKTFVVPHILEKSGRAAVTGSVLTLAPGQTETVSLLYDLTATGDRSTSTYHVVLHDGSGGEPQAMRLKITITIDCTRRPCSVIITIEF